MEGRGGNRNQNLADVLYGITQKADYPCETTADPKWKWQHENKECNWEEKNIIIKNVLEKATDCAARRARARTTQFHAHMKQRG